MTTAWEVLGGDPAPGDARSLEAAAGGIGKVLEEVGAHRAEVRALLGGLVQSGWSGRAADRFAQLLRAVDHHLEQMEAAHEPVGRGLSRHSALLAERQPEARRLLARAEEASRRRESETLRRDDAQQRRDQATAVARQAEHDVSSLGAQIAHRAQELINTGAHLVGDVAGVFDPHLRGLQELQDAARHTFDVALGDVRVAEGVIGDAERAIGEAVDELETACRRAAHIAAEVLASVRATWRLISEVDSRLEGIWHHAEQAFVADVNRSTGEIAGELTQLSPALGFAFRQYVQFEKGVVDGVIGIGSGIVGLGKALWAVSPDRMLLDPTGWWHSESALFSDVGKMASAVQHHPAAFFKRFGEGVLNWQTWAHDPAKAAGELVPSIALAVASAGTGTAAEGVADTARAAGSFDEALHGIDQLDKVDKVVHTVETATHAADSLAPAPPSAPAAETVSAQKGHTPAPHVAPEVR